MGLRIGSAATTRLDTIAARPDFAATFWWC